VALDIPPTGGEVRVYTTRNCGYCVVAKRLLAKRGVPYVEIDVTGDAAARARLVAATGRRTVPQIFIHGEPIGGYDELAALDRSGRLERLLAGTP
jgi:glutaredoxin 3